MIRLHPVPEASHVCPSCRGPLEVRGWHIPGMRNLADLSCPACRREFYGDLPAGQALYSPQLIDRESGEVCDPNEVRWFADWLRESYARRTDVPLPFSVREHKKLCGRAVLLNCLDTLYGHSLLKLLNAQYYLERRSDIDLIVMIPGCLEWMVPDGVAQTWVVGLPLREGTRWSDWLAGEIKRRIAKLEECYLSLAISHPHPADYDIERFTRVPAFPVGEWEARLRQPAVTFIWREDRLWSGPRAHAEGRLSKLKRRLTRAEDLLSKQAGRVTALAEELRERWPELDFAVAGLGQPGGLPSWISDLRRPAVGAADERVWCERYASSHIVVGVHGSNMLLPSAHAGSVVDLMPEDRWGNVLQDLLLRPGDGRELLFRYRMLPALTPPGTLARVLDSMLRDHQGLLLTMSPAFCRHEADYRELRHNNSRWRTQQETAGGAAHMRGRLHVRD